MHLSIPLLLLTSLPTVATAQISMQWTSPTTGTIESHSVTASGHQGGVLVSRNLAVADYAAAPLSSSQEGLLFEGHSNWSVDISPPITRLLWYGDRIRGQNGSSTGQPILYVFDQPFEILSGFSQATVFANTLRVPPTGLHSGILRFFGSVSSISCVTNNDSAATHYFTLGQYDVELGSPYCSPAAVNSTGVAAEMTITGSDYPTDNLVRLRGSAFPQNSFAFFLTSQTQGFIPMPAGSAGNLCLAGSIGRFVGAGQIQSTGVFGQVSLDIDLSAHPTPLGLVQVVAGDTWNFQCWYRDAVGGVAGSNFSEAISVDFR